MKGIDRRCFLEALGKLSFFGLISSAGFPMNSQLKDLDQPNWFAASKAADQYWLYICYRSQYYQFKLPGRGHGGAVHPNRPEVVLVGRRPASWACVVSQLGHQPQLQKLYAAKRRHFFGHCCYSRDGAYLFLTENKYKSDVLDRAEGIIGIYEVNKNYQKVAELSSYGIGPHELKMIPDPNQSMKDQCLVVANGGILTHPEMPRVKQNVSSMRPNLSYIDHHTGKLLHRVSPSHHQLSLRHLDVGPDGLVAVGAQFQGNMKQVLPLLFHSKLDLPALEPFQAPTKIWRQLNQYIASVTFSDQGHRLLISSPRGHKIMAFDVNRQDYLGQLTSQDVSGIAAGSTSGEFMVSNGQGKINRVSEQKGRLIALTLDHQSVAWDNHFYSFF